MRMIGVSMEQRRNEKGVGGTEDPRGNPPTSGIVRHDSHVQKSETTPHFLSPTSAQYLAFPPSRLLEVHQPKGGSTRPVVTHSSFGARTKLSAHELHLPLTASARLRTLHIPVMQTATHTGSDDEDDGNGNVEGQTDMEVSETSTIRAEDVF
ncbi:hypothetical protein PR048_001225 [Dryococelus australis]|uniref:Uncharacterized protein n=1 Tax=Dryococelus australis TaxID=614101 RepID=A0ABQ9II85_9NEOP|nr:hypothetical protein PR048_001225 [Dryococelus australis]